MLIIVDYGLGNVNSIQNMLKKIGVKSSISGNKKDILNAEKLILPGVGAFDTGINNLKRNGLKDILDYKAMQDKIPILGICLGMQLMCNKSEEGTCGGLSWFDVNLIKFNTDNGLKVPHMNWSSTSPIKDSKLLQDFDVNAKFYHVHSYHIKGYPSEAILESEYQGFKFVSALQKDNIIGVQFHPEKSHKYGMQLLSNFNRYY